MSDQAAARRYAAAFLEIAHEQGEVVRMGEDLDEVLSIAREGGGLLMKVLSSPAFTADERRKVLDQVLPALEVHALTRNLVRLLADRGRFGLLPELVRHYADGADLLAGRVRVQVTTAEPLSAELANEIRQTLARATGKQVVLEPQVEAALIGGLVARVGGRVYDGSLRSRLDDLKRKLLTGALAGEA
jgi:F-type H+-transporting ATPase subunit delta